MFKKDLLYIVISMYLANEVNKNKVVSKNKLYCFHFFQEM